MKKKKNYKRMTAMMEIRRKELKAGWVAFKQIVLILAPFVVVDVIADAELESGSFAPGWMWGLEIVAVAGLLYACTAKTLLLDRKGGVMVTLYPFLLSRWSKRIKLSSLMRGFFLLAPLMAVTRTMTREPHTGFTLFASVYLGFFLFALLVTMGRRRGRQRWLQNIAGDTAVQEIKAIDLMEEIEGPGWYVLAKYPSWAIRVTKVKGSYGAEIQVETISGWHPLCNRRERPKRTRKIHQLVRELRKMEAELDEGLDKALARLGVSV
ncbi:MAG: hypothetical protein WAM60_09155 [Candidatus Promineifilaceae bacterium]